ncbi:MAG: alpha/beta hydrolase [Thermoanaerobaculia bacterium]
MELLTEFLRADRAFVADAEPDEIRRRERPTPMSRGLRRRVELEPAAVAGVGGLWVTPEDGDGEAATVLYLHGGGYCFCSTDTHRGLIGYVAHYSGARCFAPNYHLAPEHRHPAAIEDAVAVYRALLADGVAPERLFLAGDSAGGGLALATLLELRLAGDPLPRAAVLMSPWVDLACEGESIDENGVHDYLSRKVLEVFAGYYLGDADPRTPSASPIYADLTGLPPLHIQVGGAETLLSEGRTLAERAAAAGVDTELRVWDGAVHVFQAFAPFVSEATEALRAAGRFVRERSEKATG